MINTDMSGKDIDRSLQAISEVEDVKNNDKILYIHNGELAFDTYENLFTVISTG